MAEAELQQDEELGAAQTAESDETVSANPDEVYIDSCVYLDYLQGDTDHHAALERMFQAWLDGDLTITTSALTLAEVLWVKRGDDGAHEMIDPDREPEILALFRPSARRRLRLVELDRRTGELAREFVWRHRVHPKDAVHLASAVRARAPRMFTRDAGLLRLDGLLDPPLRIERPRWVVQTALSLDSSDTASAHPMGDSAVEPAEDDHDAAVPSSTGELVAVKVDSDPDPSASTEAGAELESVPDDVVDAKKPQL